MSLAHDPDTVTRGVPSLNQERFTQARAIFEAAVERPAAERRAYASGACASDEELLREVQAMLAADARVDPLLDRSPSQPPSSAPEEGRFPAGAIAKPVRASLID